MAPEPVLRSPLSLKLNPKELSLVILLVGVGLASVYFTLFFKPLQQKMVDLKTEEEKINEQTQGVIAQFPDLDGIKKELEQAQGRIKAIENEGEGVEGKLLSEPQLTQFLGELLECSGGLTIDFQTVKQNIEPDKSGFSRLLVDMKFGSKYEEMINYLARVEKLSPYVKVETLDVVQPPTDTTGMIMTSIKLNAILASPAQPNKKLDVSCDNSNRMTVAKNPMMPAVKATNKKERSLKIAGITYREGQVSSAIINDTIVREGDEIDGQTVKKILSDTVILFDGNEEYSLTMED